MSQLQCWLFPPLHWSFLSLHLLSSVPHSRSLAHISPHFSLSFCWLSIVSKPWGKLSSVQTQLLFSQMTFNVDIVLQEDHVLQHP